MSVKLEGFVKPYRGKPDQSWDTFWSKFSILADVSGWTSDADVMKRLPLFLEGDAFLVFSKMTSGDKKDKDKVSAMMLKSFGAPKSVAYKQFVSRHLREDESVDAFVADLRRLLAQSGHTDTGEKDAMVIEQLLAGVPLDVAQQTRLAFAGKEMTVSGCSDAIRAIVSMQCPNRSVAAAAKSSSCFKCGKPGHFQRNCPQGQPRSARPSGGQRASRTVCYFCEKVGHTRAECHERKAWEASKGVSAAMAAYAHPKCLATVAVEGPLPHIFVDVSTDGNNWQRARSVIDTGSNRTLIDSTFAAKHGLEPTHTTASTITAIDGKPLSIVGVVPVKIQRTDGPVSLPCIAVDACIVNSLDVVQSEILIGIDVVTGSGGLFLDYSESNELSQVVFGAEENPSIAPPEASAAAVQINADEIAHPSFHVRAERDGADVVLSTDDAEVRWDSTNQRWQVAWKWKPGSPPPGTIGNGIGEYSRSRLTPAQEELFTNEVDGWIERGWLVPHNESVHGKPVCVLPLLAQVQEHKSTTPVRPCLDYRKLNECLESKPGLDVPVCEETLRRWRCVGDADEFCLMDIKKAYLQIHLAPELLKYQVVRWKGQTYVMTRMAFGLNVAPKVMDVVVRWITQSFPGVDNYIDDILSPKAIADQVAAKLEEYGLPTKPAESLPSTRVLGLQLSKDEEGQILWARRTGIDLELSKQPTLRDLFSWCGRLTGHVPICGWLRPYCSYLKRIANTGVSWDKPLTDPLLLQFCNELSEKLAGDGDPACGLWGTPAGAVEESECVVYADASDIALGAVIQLGDVIVEDRSWLRPHNDKRHINVVELEAMVKALSLATQWGCRSIKLVTDSKTVASWLRDVVGNVCRVRAKGLYGTLVQRRLQIVADMVATCDLAVTVDWVPTDQNPADVLTRVPAPWIKHCKELKGEDVVAIAATAKMVGPLTMTQIAKGQCSDIAIQTVVSCLSENRPVPAEFAKVRSQLVVENGILLRSVKLPVDGVVSVPVIPDALVADVLAATHSNSGHAAWDTMYDMIRSRCYFPSIAAACQRYVSECVQCAAANPSKGPSVPATRADIPGRPWGEVVIDVLELGSSSDSSQHCVLMCVDTFSKWVEVVPLQRHDAISVASAFTSLCERWGAPDVIRTDNGTEFRNAIVESLFKLMGVRVQHGAVHHPQSQGSAERANRTLISLILKVLEPSSDWRKDLSMLLFYYRNRPHSATGITPMMAMTGWQPPHLIVANETHARDLSQWAEQLSERSARIRDLIEEELSAADFLEADGSCPYSVGDNVLLEARLRRQKRQPPFESGWNVSHIISKSSVVISKPGRLDKVVNVSSVKPDPTPVVASDCVPNSANDECMSDEPSVSSEFDDDSIADDDDIVRIDLTDITGMPGRRLRDRNAIVRPHRYRE